MSRYMARAAVALSIALGCAWPAHAQLQGQVYVSGLSAPVAFVQDPSDSTVQYVVELGGLIRVVKNGTLQTTAFLNLTAAISTGGERGLLGLAFPPNYGA